MISWLAEWNPVIKRLYTLDVLGGCEDMGFLLTFLTRLVTGHLLSLVESSHAINFPLQPINNFPPCHPIDFRLPNKLSSTERSGLLTAPLQVTANWTDTPLSNVSPFTSFIPITFPPPNWHKAFISGRCVRGHSPPLSQHTSNASPFRRFKIQHYLDRFRTVSDIYRQGYNPLTFDIASRVRVLVCTRLSV
ncbi:hypothetical protein HNY73_011876 [Argiope bruennichi]|uniref:Uncharacterized protein n=1 Tax=Argiope bruennichi TaxID=94029 RepID=A0A8T0EV74_ARGBR|nr:hypothetical protein HNY73_011876 [Argiope bruennichi]